MCISANEIDLLHKGNQGTATCTSRPWRFCSIEYKVRVILKKNYFGVLNNRFLLMLGFLHGEPLLCVLGCLRGKLACQQREMCCSELELDTSSEAPVLI